jgi:rubrerythrin
LVNNYCVKYGIIRYRKKERFNTMEKMMCLVCNEEFEVNGFEQCPCCGAVGDDLIPAEDDEEEVDA